MSMTETNIDTGTVLLGNNQFEDGPLTFAAAGTVKEGTILARDSSTKKFVPYVKGGTTNGNGVPVAILSYDVTAAASGDKMIRPAIAGEFRKQRLVIAADGNASNVDALVLDALRDTGLVAISVRELGATDNQ